MISNAKISNCDRYRYLLTRTWDDSLQSIGAVCLNPSTADAATDDNTVRKCVCLAKYWGYGGLVLVNLFAWRATKRNEIKSVKDPVGPKNDSEIRSALSTVDDVLVAWGNDGVYLNRSETVRGVLLGLKKNFICIKTNANGEPIHPLYQSNTSDYTSFDLSY